MNQNNDMDFLKELTQDEIIQLKKTLQRLLEIREMKLKSKIK